MVLVSRKQWGAEIPTGVRNNISPKPAGTAIHWEGPYMGSRRHTECAKVVKGIQSFHIHTRKWSDIAYNLLVCEHGFIFEGRGKGVGSAANGTTLSNAQYYAVCALVGAGDAQPPALIQGLKEAVAMTRSWGAANKVVGHRDLHTTACPGDALYAMVRKGVFNTGITKVVKAASTAIKKAQNVGKPILRQGSKGRAVIELQRGLNKVFPSYSHLSADGDFGQKTKLVVIEFQRRSHLSADGVVGVKTRAALAKYGISF